MSYARPTLISRIVRKRRKVSINRPRNEDEACPSLGGVSGERPHEKERERKRKKAPVRREERREDGEKRSPA